LALGGVVGAHGRNVVHVFDDGCEIHTDHHVEGV
jgi:hypothetical protein